MLVLDALFDHFHRISSNVEITGTAVMSCDFGQIFPVRNRSGEPMAAVLADLLWWAITCRDNA
jgi:hypothetical protein